MTDELQKLRQKMYNSAAIFYRDQSRYSDKRLAAVPPRQLELAAQACRAAGQQYAAALDELLGYLQKLGTAGLAAQEVERVRRRKELLHDELSAIPPQ